MVTRHYVGGGSEWAVWRGGGEREEATMEEVQRVGQSFDGKNPTCRCSPGGAALPIARATSHPSRTRSIKTSHAPVAVIHVPFMATVYYNSTRRDTHVTICGAMTQWGGRSTDARSWRRSTRWRRRHPSSAIEVLPFASLTTHLGAETGTNTSARDLWGIQVCGQMQRDDNENKTTEDGKTDTRNTCPSATYIGVCPHLPGPAREIKTAKK